MSARCLTAGEDYAYYLLLSSGCICALNECDLGLTICVGEKSLDLVLVCNRLCSSTFLYADLSDTVSKHARKLGLILISCLLKW